MRNLLRSLVFDRAIRLAIVAFCILALPTSVTAASPDFTKAMSFYNHRQFEDALNCFVKDGQAQNNSSAFMYAANCLMFLGRKDEAIGCYWYLVHNCPSSREAYEARNYLKRVDGAYLRHANDKAAGKLPVIDAAAAAESASKPALALTPSKDDVIADLVTTIRAQAGRPDVSASLVSNIKKTLASYPMNLLLLLQKNNCKVCLTPTLIDKEPGLQNTKPRGYEDGSTYKNCPGMFDGNIVVCQYAAHGVDDWEPTEDPIGCLRHEIGHAFDYFGGNIAESEEFKHAYYLDCGNIDDSVKNKISYYVQKAEGGPSECFAELVAYKFGGRNSNNDRCSLVHSSFPEASKVVDSKLEAAR